MRGHFSKSAQRGQHQVLQALLNEDLEGRRMSEDHVLRLPEDHLLRVPDIVVVFAPRMRGERLAVAPLQLLQRDLLQR